MIEQFFDTMIVASSDKEWVERPIQIYLLETVLSHLKTHSLRSLIKNLQDEVKW